MFSIRPILSFAPTAFAGLIRKWRGWWWRRFRHRKSSTPTGRSRRKGPLKIAAVYVAARLLIRAAERWRALPSSSCAKSQPLERTSTTNIRFRRRRWHSQPAFPANPRRDLLCRRVMPLCYQDNAFILIVRSPRPGRQSHIPVHREMSIAGPRGRSSRQDPHNRGEEPRYAPRHPAADVRRGAQSGGGRPLSMLAAEGLKAMQEGRHGLPRHRRRLRADHAEGRERRPSGRRRARPHPLPGPWRRAGVRR